ncbi:MAG: DUF1073 domain-containing protein [Gammaproteobacteria bacterium]|nr:DUF1073 domain-containing protein [Gammaproteobacteria bacterium]NIR85217.1 DUF1073 domain-containing protein [Gammaproteobacteria bacterium]NIU06267.1 DUF1073 domain-containing protein [Gammaproteobacteria bacterium]NIX87540.1 DUF1073 domain-containing protein [Gammaproteobacteria bacterium]
MYSELATAALLRLDAFANELTGLGTKARDKVVNALFYRQGRKSDQYLEGLYEEDPLARRICDKLPEEVLRNGFDLSMGDEQDAVETATWVQDELKRLHAFERIESGMVWERVFGGSAVLIGADEGPSATDPAQPLREEALQRVTHLTVIDRPRIYAKRWYPPESEKVGQVELWSIQPPGGGTSGSSSGVVDVHESRLLIFPGGRVTHDQRVAYQGWGQSVLNAVHDVLREYNMSWSGLSHMLQSANQDVWKMKGLAAALAGGTEAMKAYFFSRIQMAQMRQGPNRAILLDSEGEEFARHGSHFTGVPETMQQQALRLSAVTGMPLTVLMGMSPAGMNATGESDLQIWHGTVQAARERKAQPGFERLIELIMLQKQGDTAGRVVEGWSLKWRPLKELSEKERVELRKAQAEVDKIYEEMGALLPEEIAENRFRPEGYSTETSIDLDARAAILEAERQERVEAEAKAKAALEQAPVPRPEPDGEPDEPPDDPDE